MYRRSRAGSSGSDRMARHSIHNSSVSVKRLNVCPHRSRASGDHLHVGSRTAKQATVLRHGPQATLQAPLRKRQFRIEEHITASKRLTRHFHIVNGYRDVWHSHAPVSACVCLASIAGCAVRLNGSHLKAQLVSMTGCAKLFVSLLWISCLRHLQAAESGALSRATDPSSTSAASTQCLHSCDSA